ncbi:hypothetical protein JVX91_18175 [Pseudomonas sp. PDNC002]|uniref:hypothetical protein n=1 Tax=Pseudomonas sp. PDNC002 TaxID=2811422 RepID=UPI0019655B7B|nr:hypothetical protein [Pseudomonas sp. PDNC002]QRY77526.1 hypothetical protein JVX91_18175 [Pseudomonas sp. PDNC002]
MTQPSQRFARPAGLAATLLCMSLSPAYADQVLYQVGTKPLFDGRFGDIAAFQGALNALPETCKLLPVTVDGQFGQSTRKAIQHATQCDAIKSALSPNSPAFKGALTEDLWKSVMPSGSPSPSYEKRAQTLVLTYEATDYDRLEWNFCQNKPFWTPANPSAPCYTNDPSSLITWGPRGATAGGGKEVQWVLWQLDQQHPASITNAFGSEAAAVRTLFTLNSNATRAMLCSVYVDPKRRGQWTAGFQKIGEDPAVRQVYDAHYLSTASDGSKMASLFRLYQRLGVSPTTVDYGFFLDRATHSSPPSDTVSAAQKIKGVLSANHWPLTPANVRRAYSRAFPTSNQTRDRLGRDVAYFVDALGIEGLTAEEKSAWVHRGTFAASEVGLFDSQAASKLVPTPATVKGPPFDQAGAAFHCPASVLNPRKP